MSNLDWLSEAQMDRLRPYFPKSRGRARVDDRRVLSGIIFINRNGLRWCDAPSEYGPPKTLYNRWKRWSDMGVFARIMMGLAEQDPDNKAISIPSHRNCVSTAGQWMQPTSKRTALPQAWG
jgi:transposase